MRCGRMRGMAEQPSRKRRIAKLSLYGTATILLVQALYVGTFLAMCWWQGAGSAPPISPTSSAFTPLRAYAKSDVPGGLTFHAASIWFLNRSRTSFSICYRLCQAQHARGDAELVGGFKPSSTVPPYKPPDDVEIPSAVK